MGSETLGLRSARRLQPRVSLGQEKEGVTDYTAGPEWCRVQGPGAHPWPAPRRWSFPGDPSLPGSRSTCGCCLPSSFLKLVFLGTGCLELGRGGAVVGSRSGLAFSGLGGDLKFQSSPGGSLDLKHLGGCSPDSASGCSACRRRCWEDGCFPGLQPLREPTPPPLAPRCWESRWWPRAGRRAAQTAASPERRAGGDSSQ